MGRDGVAEKGSCVPDVIAPGLVVLFCGINPGMRSAALGQHFAHPANRFWKVLHRAGFTAQVLEPWDTDGLLSAGLGITNLVARATRRAGELTAAELRAGAEDLEVRVRHFHPDVVAVVGMGAYRTAFRRPAAAMGPQLEPLGPARLWLLPNPSGLQARYQMEDLVDAYGALRAASGGAPAGRARSGGRGEGADGVA